MMYTMISAGECAFGQDAWARIERILYRLRFPLTAAEHLAEEGRGRANAFIAAFAESQHKQLVRETGGMV